MIVDHSAYAALGLRPGAGRAEIDEAYRRLIKRYHPDRMGGDSGRAADINRAYTQLRRDSAMPVRPRRAVPVPVHPPKRRRRATGWLVAFGIVAAAAVAVATDFPGSGFDRPDSSDAFAWASTASQPMNSTAAWRLADFDEPLQAPVIDLAIADAMKFHAGGDLEASAEFSRACHNRLRERPSLTWFDSCAAFDEATLTLKAAEPFADSGPFNPSAVMARNLGAARLLSHDMLAADSRLHQIRSRVEMALIPRLDEAAAQRP